MGKIVQKSDTPFALVDFLFSLLDREAQDSIQMAAQMLKAGISSVDFHDNYSNLRFGYWEIPNPGLNLSMPAQLTLFIRQRTESGTASTVRAPLPFVMPGQAALYGKLLFWTPITRSA